MDDRKMTQEDIKIVFETAKTLLELSYKLREVDLLPELGKEITMLADKTLKVVEETPIDLVDVSVMDLGGNSECMCKPGECQSCDDQRNQCHGHTEQPEQPEDPETMCNGHNAMGPGGGQPENQIVMDFPTGNSNPDIDNEINNLLNKVRGQIDGK
jgi:hypothetical protein